MRRLKGIIKLIVVFATVAIGAADANAQAPLNNVAPPDSEFVMQVVREKGAVMVNLSFSDSLLFDYITIERKAEFDLNFSQCKYISYAEIKALGMEVKKQDKYPLPSTVDVLYRMKIISPDGIIRIYPAVLLASLRH